MQSHVFIIFPPWSFLFHRHNRIPHLACLEIVAIELESLISQIMKD